MIFVYALIPFVEFPPKLISKHKKNFCFQLKFYLTDLFLSYIFTPQQLWRAFSRQCTPDYLPATATTGTNNANQPLSACGRLKLALTFHLVFLFFCVLFCPMLSVALAMPLEAVECTFPTAVPPSLFNAYKYTQLCVCL